MSYTTALGSDIPRAYAIDSPTNRQLGVQEGFNLSFFGQPIQYPGAAAPAASKPSTTGAAGAGGYALGSPASSAAGSNIDYGSLMAVPSGEKSIGNAIGRGIMAGARNEQIAQLPQGYEPVLANFELGTIKSKAVTA